MTTDSKDFSRETNNYMEENPSEHKIFHELKKKKKTKKVIKFAEKILKEID